VVDLNNAVGDVTVPDFTICIQGPSYPDTPDCKTFSSPNDLVQTWENLKPGEYTVTEQDPGDEWDVEITPETVTVNAGDDPSQAQVTVTDTFQPGSLQVTKVVDLNNAVGDVTVPDFTICIQGPSYPNTPDCKTFSSPNDLVQTWENLMPGEYAITENDPGANWDVDITPETVTVNSGDDPEQAQVTVTDTFQPGSLEVTKVVDLNNAVGDVTVPDFTICVQGPSYPDTPDCKTFSSPNDLVQTWENLIPGQYTITENDPGANWDVDITPETVTVNPGDDPEQAQVTVTDTFQPGSLEVTKVVDWGNVTPDPNQEFEICIQGPSYPNGTEAGACQTIDFDGGTLTWEDLIPGNYTVTETDPGTSWTVDISGSPATVPPDGQGTATVTNTKKEGPEDPFEFDKTGDTLSKVGDEVNYTLTLTNTTVGNPPLVLKCRVTDAMLGIDEEVELDPGDPPWVWNETYTVPPGANDPLVNTAEVSCTVDSSVVQASATHSVNLFQPGVEVQKTGPQQSKVGEKVTYSVTIINTSSDDSPDLMLDSVTDSLVDLSGQVPAACGTLGDGDTCNFTYDYTVKAGDPDPLVNTVEVHYHPRDFPNDITDDDDHQIDLVQPVGGATRPSSVLVLLAPWLGLAALAALFLGSTVLVGRRKAT
jgi:hypothetical protein